MALTLVATAGAADANSYAALADAELYFEQRLHVSSWTGADQATREAALVWATALLDRDCNWKGYKMTEAQALRWPRGSIYDPDGDDVTDSAIPQFLKDATAELALHLIQGDRTLDTNPDLIGFKQLDVGPIGIKVDKYAKKSVIPPSVWAIIRPYCTNVGRTKTLVRM